MAEEIKELQNELDELTKTKTSKTVEFNRTFKKEISLESFTKLTNYEDVDEKIKEIQSTIETANNQSKIKSVFNSIDIILQNIAQQNTRENLSQSIQVKAEKVSEHILKTWKDPNHSHDFLQTGLELTKDKADECVFCGQDLDVSAKELLNAYSRLFSEEYKTIQKNITGTISKFEKWNPQNIIESIQDKLATINLEINIENANAANTKELKDYIDKEFSKKLEDLSYEVNFQEFEKLIQIFENINQQIIQLKEGNIFNSEVNIAALNSKIKELEFSKIRHSKEWDDFLKEYEDIDILQETKKTKRESLRDQLNQYSEKLFATHLDSINKTLDQLGADFTICEFQPIKHLKGEKERIFAINFFKNHTVYINETQNCNYNFKNTLSDSDRRVLAFSFFYSLMIHDEHLDKKIIVFDDPFSSLDADRRTKTSELLANPQLITADGVVIEKIINQLIILTHEKEFFKWIYQKLDAPKALRIVGDGTDANGIKTSTFKDCDVYKEFIEHQNKKDLKEIKEIHESNKTIADFGGLCGKCRKILESIFTRKYFFELQDEINKNKSIRSFTDKLKELGINDYSKQTKYKDFIFLCDNLNIELHDNSMSNDGGNANIVLGDFLKLIREI